MGFWVWAGSGLIVGALGFACGGWPAAVLGGFAGLVGLPVLLSLIAPAIDDDRQGPDETKSRRE